MQIKKYPVQLRVVLTLCLCAVLACSLTARAEIFGHVHGIVHDPQHRPIQDANVDLKAQHSEYVQHLKTNDSGEFDFSAVPLGEYTVTVAAPNFQQIQQNVVVESGASPVLHFQLDLAGVTEKTVVTGEPIEASVDSATPTTLLSRQNIQDTPGADRTNSLAMITDYVPGAYVTHDQLHIRGGHQVSWLIDGVPVPNTNIASNVGPQFDPKDIDYMEVQRGSYDADYGDRTYGVFNVVPRSGFERDKECDVVASLGNFYQTNDQLSCGGHSERFAYYGSLSGNRSNLGLEPATPQVLHDAENGISGFGSLIFNLNPKNQLRLVVSSRRDFYQIPVSPGLITEITGAPGAISITPCFPATTCVDSTGTPQGGIYQFDGQHESDTFVNFSWVRTFSPASLLTVSPFFHYNAANYTGNANDFPTDTTEDRSSLYAGAQVTFSATIARNSISAGYYGFYQHDNQLFAITYTDGGGTNLSPDREIVAGNLNEVWIEDKFKPTSWLTLNGGVRASFFAGTISENATSPRVGVSVRAPKIDWVLHGFYGRFYQAPPLETFSGPALIGVATGQGYNFGSLHGERDEEYQFGLTIPYKGWSVDADTFRTRANNFFDHNNLGESNVFIPVTLTEALIRGWELTLKSPKLWKSAQLHMAYSNQIGEFRGNITGGLIPTDNAPSPDYAPLDHDQRNTLNAGLQTVLPWRAFASVNIYYGSGFTNGNGPTVTGGAPCCSSLDYLPSHTTLDLSAGKDITEKFSISASAINVGNRRVMLDDSLTFGGFHFSNPREIFVELRYRFHY
ncbi:MAG TPA: TonB-dependent receptor [Candidatus Acidoferrales bacterium]|nr:TonB-dependent receptor [Candidatus Acidoferrales bacterium]